MSALIERNQIAWKNQTPWHGLGTQVAENATGEEMLIAAGLDWKVQRRALAMRSGDGTGLLSEQLKDYRAIVRKDTDEVFAITSDRYHTVQNLDVVNLFRDYCDAGGAEMDVVGALKGGRIVWALAKLNGQTHKVLKGSDELVGYIVFATSHDGSIRTIGMATSIRVVCANTFFAALSAKGGMKGCEFSLKHSSKWTPERAKEAKTKLGIASEKIQRAHEVAEQLSRVSIDRAGQIEFVSRLMDGKCLLDQVTENTETAAMVASGFDSGSSILDAILAGPSPVVSAFNPEDKLNRVGKAILESILDSPGSHLESASGTFWGAVNGVTYYTDHLAARNQDNRLASSWFGQNELLKRSAFQTAVDMTGIKVG